MVLLNKSDFIQPARLHALGGGEGWGEEVSNDFKLMNRFYLLSLALSSTKSVEERGL